jgi:ubiquinone/menaquinone biosynthesis C-methylase UbiE
MQSTRQNTEELWHDTRTRERSGTKTDPVYSLDPLRYAVEYMWRRVGDVRGTTIIDVGCGTGGTAIRLARQGATVYGFDISGERIEIARSQATAAGLSDRAFFERMATEQMTYPDGLADLIIGQSILHHTDLASTSRELARILKPGGRAIFLEPLDHNPVLNLFRKLTPGRRTPTEKPLSNSDIALLSEPFSGLLRKEFFLTALFAFLFRHNRRWFDQVMSTMVLVDEKLFARFPALESYAWVVVLEWTR